ncbi:hypothetical protein JCM9534A_55770 [Catenuloplanes indicus JCM 9534]
MRRIAVLDAPSNLGLRPPTETSVPGCAKAPGALRDAGLLHRLRARDAGCLTPPRYDPGDWRPGDGVCHAPSIGAYSVALADRIGAIIDNGEFPVILGGDCSVSLGSALAMRRLGQSVGGHVGLIFVDGHSDFRHPGNASYVGAAAGEGLALITGRGQADLTALEGRRPYYRDVDVVVVGIRANDEYRLDLQAAGIVTRPVPALRAEGAPRSAQWALDQIADCAGFWVHIDVDVLDPAVMPAVDAPEPGGIAFTELEALLEHLVGTPHCLGMEITVFDPDYDPDGSYAAEIVSTVAAGIEAAGRLLAAPRPRGEGSAEPSGPAESVTAPSEAAEGDRAGMETYEALVARGAGGFTGLSGAGGPAGRRGTDGRIRRGGAVGPADPEDAAGLAGQESVSGLAGSGGAGPAGGSGGVGGLAGSDGAGSGGGSGGVGGSAGSGGAGSAGGSGGAGGPARESGGEASAPVDFAAGDEPPGDAGDEENGGAGPAGNERTSAVTTGRIRGAVPAQPGPRSAGDSVRFGSRADDGDAIARAADTAAAPDPVADASDVDPVARLRSRLTDDRAPRARLSTRLPDDHGPLGRLGARLTDDGDPVAGLGARLTDDGGPVAGRGARLTDDGGPGAWPGSPLSDESDRPDVRASTEAGTSEFFGEDAGDDDHASAGAHPDDDTDASIVPNTIRAALARREAQSRKPSPTSIAEAAALAKARFAAAAAAAAAKPEPEDPGLPLSVSGPAGGVIPAPLTIGGQHVDASRRTSGQRPGKPAKRTDAPARRTGWDLDDLTSRSGLLSPRRPSTPGATDPDASHPGSLRRPPADDVPAGEPTNSTSVTNPDVVRPGGLRRRPPKQGGSLRRPATGEPATGPDDSGSDPEDPAPATSHVVGTTASTADGDAPAESGAVSTDSGVTSAADGNVRVEHGTPDAIAPTGMPDTDRRTAHSAVGAGTEIDDDISSVPQPEDPASRTGSVVSAGTEATARSQAAGEAGLAAESKPASEAAEAIGPRSAGAAKAIVESQPTGEAESDSGPETDPVVGVDSGADAGSAADSSPNENVHLDEAESAAEPEPAIEPDSTGEAAVTAGSGPVAEAAVAEPDAVADSGPAVETAAVADADAVGDDAADAGAAVASAAVGDAAVGTEADVVPDAAAAAEADVADHAAAAAGADVVADAAADADMPADAAAVADVDVADAEAVADADVAGDAAAAAGADVAGHAAAVAEPDVVADAAAVAEAAAAAEDPVAEAEVAPTIDVAADTAATADAAAPAKPDVAAESDVAAERDVAAEPGLAVSDPAAGADPPTDPRPATDIDPQAESDPSNEDAAAQPDQAVRNDPDATNGDSATGDAPLAEDQAGDRPPPTVLGRLRRLIGASPTQPGPPPTGPARLRRASPGSGDAD